MAYDERTERIYVGGLDPSRGLTVELVASRLRSVDDVKIICIDDDAIKNGRKRVIVDEDGILVDTRNFFFLEAQATAAAKSTGASALDILAKEYHNVKWKGCQLRVEAAKPHFLKRLEDERALRSSKQRLDKQHSHNTQAENEHEKPTEEKVVKSRRRLRIRKRFGEEAYTVDTRPHPLELSLQDRDGWDEFTTLNERMHDKRQSQQNKLAERRKEERRKWASGKGFGKKHPTNSESGDLRSLIFLNRGIHIRFGGGRSSRKELAEKGVKLKNSIADEKESVTSSSVVSSVSEESFEEKKDAKGGRKPYVWSDDDDDDAEEDSERDVSSEENVDANDEEHKTGEKHAWSDEDDGDGKDDTNDDRSTRNEANEQKDKPQERNHHKVMNKRIDGSEYTKAVSIDEFSDGMDFDSAPNNFEDALALVDSRDVSDNASDCHLEDDIYSNMGILATLFPDEQFQKQPLAASVSGSKGHAGERAGAGEHGQSPNSSSVFRAGVIMQRYDPTKELDKKFEMPQVEKPINRSNAKPPAGEESDKDKANMNETSVEDASVSSESSNDEVVLTKQTTKSEGPESKSDEKPSTHAGFQTSNTAINVEGKSVPATDIYEQDKLEVIFKQAREGKESFLLANLFQGNEKGSKKEEQDGDIYEQDKLEGVFKQAREDGAKHSEGGDFAFGFHNQLPDEKTAADDGSSTLFSFGFNLSNPSKNENNLSSSQKSSDQVHDYCELTPDDGIHSSSTVKATEEQLRNEPSRRKRRVGMRFPGKDLDVYEEMLFSLNEGLRILKDLDAMKQDEESQKQWKKERLGLTADWKRKQKSALSRKVRKVRRL